MLDPSRISELSRRGFLTGSAVTALSLLAACSSDDGGESTTEDAQVAASAGVVPANLDYIPSSTPEFAILKGTWLEMGHQLGQQYPDNLLAAANIATGDAIRQCGTYEDACAALAESLEMYDTFFSDEVDGKLTDLYQGVADELGIDFEQVAFISVPLAGDTHSGPTGSAAEGETEDGKDCSAIMAWGESTATGDPGVIATMDADIDINELQYMPALVMSPTNGYTMCSTHGFFGSCVNAAGLAVETPGGSSNLDHVAGTNAQMWTAAYCATVDEAVAFLGDPDGDPETWVPAPSDYNFMLGDATGNALDYQMNSVDREIRRCHDKKVLSPTPGDEMPDESSTYLHTNNLYLTPRMLDNVLSNVRQGIPFYWDDVEPRYWTIDKVLSDAVENGGITLDTLVAAESETRYYVPEGWDYDYFADWLFGFWVPSVIYDKLDEDGGITRAEYYGEAYDPEMWGEPMAKEESRQVEAWAAGWHEPSWSATPEVSTMGYWSPTPVSSLDKNALRNVFDSNSRTMWLMKGSSDRLLANQTAATGTFAKLQFVDPASEALADEQLQMVSDMILDLKLQLWIAAKDIEKAGIDLDTADGQVLQGYVDMGKDALFQAINYQAQGASCMDTDERLLNYSRAASILAHGRCYTQLAQADPMAIEKDAGDIMELVQNLEAASVAPVE